jgi:hypothetical protein
LLRRGAAVAYAVLALATPRLGAGTIRGMLLAAWLLHAPRWPTACSASRARFGFAPALSVTVWLVLTVYAVESRLFPQLQARWALAGPGRVAVLLAHLSRARRCTPSPRPGCRCTGRWASRPTGCSPRPWCTPGS